MCKKNLAWHPSWSRNFQGSQVLPWYQATWNRWCSTNYSSHKRCAHSWHLVLRLHARFPVRKSVVRQPRLAHSQIPSLPLKPQIAQKLWYCAPCKTTQFSGLFRKLKKVCEAHWLEYPAEPGWYLSAEFWLESQLVEFSDGFVGDDCKKHWRACPWSQLGQIRSNRTLLMPRQYCPSQQKLVFFRSLTKPGWHGQILLPATADLVRGNLREASKKKAPSRKGKQMLVDAVRSHMKEQF